MAKQYAEPEAYEVKLEKVMSRLGVEKYDYDWSRRECWVEFFYKGQAYRFEHSVENAQSHGMKIRYGSDVFAQVVLTLEDIARMVERGIYDLSTWVSGLRCLPAAEVIPQCFIALQFDTIPTEEELKKRFRQLSKSAHPDAGGSDEQFIILKEAYDEACKLLGGGTNE